MNNLERIKKYCDEAKKHNEWEYFESQARTDLPRCVEALEYAINALNQHAKLDIKFQLYTDKINSILKGEK